MKSKKPAKPSRQDIAWQHKVEKQAKVEKIELDHPQGKNRFEKVVRHALKKKS